MSVKKRKLVRSYFISRHGFTIIELLVVFSVMAILSSIGVASFTSYTNSQKLRNATLDVRTYLSQARSQSSTQVTPATCTNFQGYEVRICCLSMGVVATGANCPVCLSSGNYELDAICSNAPNGILIRSSTLPTGVSINSAQTTGRTFRFIPVTGGVVAGGVVTLTGSDGSNQSVTITNLGVIQ